MSSACDTLVVVPYVGEFGWELMNWQGRVRWVIAHQDYQRVVLCQPPASGGSTHRLPVMGGSSSAR